jgi:hypothetical protein
MPAGQRLLFTSQLRDSDAALLADPAVEPFTWTRFLRRATDPDLELMEVAEPLWLGEWVRAVRYVALARMARAVIPGRRRLTVATYAIENLDVGARVSFRSLDAHPVLGAVAALLARALLGASLVSLDAIAFGTTGACENYSRAFGRRVARTTHAVLPPRLGECTVCGPAASTGVPREPTMVFLGTPSERKGFPVLMAAWERCGAVDAGWQLVVADPSGEPAPPVPPGVSILSAPARHAVHELLRTSAVVAMPSVRLRRWREQIGLPLVEGLAHGCRVVTTSETGLAEDLVGHPLVTFTTAGDSASLADGLRRAMTPGPDVAEPTLDGFSKRDVVAWWLAIAAR